MKKYYLKNADNLGWGPKTAKINPLRAKDIQDSILGNKILDIGCGTGIWVDYFQRQGYQSAGVDFVDQFINFAKDNYQGKFISAEAENLPFKKNSFDTVLLISVLEHVEEEINVLKEALRVGNRLIIIVPQKTPNILKNKGLVFKHHLDKTHQRVYTKKSLIKLAEKLDLKIVKIKEIERLPSISIFPKLFQAPKLLSRILTRLWFWIFKEKKYYLELMIVLDKIC